MGEDWELHKIQKTKGIGWGGQGVNIGEERSDRGRAAYGKLKPGGRGGFCILGKRIKR